MTALMEAARALSAAYLLEERPKGRIEAEAAEADALIIRTGSQSRSSVVICGRQG